MNLNERERVIACTIIMLAAVLVPYSGTCFSALFFIVIIMAESLFKAFAEMVVKINKGE